MTNNHHTSRDGWYMLEQRIQAILAPTYGFAASLLLADFFLIFSL